MNRRAFLCQLACAAGAIAATAASVPVAHALTPAPLKPPQDVDPVAPEPAISHGDEAKVEDVQWGWRRRRFYRRRFFWRRRRYFVRRRRFFFRRRRFWRRRYW